MTVPSPADPGLLATVALPAEIDIANAEQVEDDLRAACGPGVTVVADMSGTTFSDTSGIRALFLARAQAVSVRGDLRPVVPSALVRRVLTLAGLPEVMAVYLSLPEALAASPADPGVVSP